MRQLFETFSTGIILILIPECDKEWTGFLCMTLILLILVLIHG